MLEHFFSSVIIFFLENGRELSPSVCPHTTQHYNVII